MVNEQGLLMDYVHVHVLAILQGCKVHVICISLQYIKYTYNMHMHMYALSMGQL